MEWVFGTVIAVVFGLYIWSVASTRRQITKKIQPVIDDLFDLDKKPPE
jgi:type IV secretory pathway TrbD component